MQNPIIFYIVKKIFRKNKFFSDHLYKCMAFFLIMK